MKNNPHRKLLLSARTLILMLILLQPGTISAQHFHLSQSIGTSFIKKDIKHFSKAGIGLLKAPFTFDMRDWMQVGFAVSSTALIFALDKNIKKAALQNQNKLNDVIFNIDSYQGNQYSLILSGGLYVFGALTGNSKRRKTGLLATEAFIYSGTVTGLLKILISRRRPYAGDHHLVFKPFQFSDNDYQSLPSGHTTVSFAVATALAKSTDNRYGKIFWYGTAGMVGASRIYHNKHWVSDVFLAAVIGYRVGDYVARFDVNEKPLLGSCRIQPWITPNAAGFSLYLK